MDTDNPGAAHPADAPTPAPTPAATPPPIPPQPPESAAAPPRRPPVAFALGPAATPARPRTGRGWKIAVLVLSLLLGMALISNLSHTLGELSASGDGESQFIETVLRNNHAAAKIVVIPVEGIITGTGDGAGHSLVDRVKAQLELAAKDERVKAVILKVNSPGGEVLASDDIARAVEKFQDKHFKPVVAAMGSLAASGGYYISAPCRWIVAHELTITGSIGVIMQTYNYRALMNKVGLRPVTFKSGKFKDMLGGDKDLENASPETKALYAEEEAMVQRMVNETFQRFKSVVETGRNQANKQNEAMSTSPGRKLRADWANFADGRILSGKEAHEIGLVDETGDWDAAVARAKSLTGVHEANLITYQQPFTLGNLFRIFGRTDARPVKVDVGLEVPRLQSGLYFVAPTFLH